MKALFDILIPSWSELFCTFLAFFIPFMLFRMNEMLYEIGNPNWKRKESKKLKDID